MRLTFENEALTQQTIGCAMTVHRILGPGFLESVYQNALAHELRKAGLKVECEKEIQVFYDESVVGLFCADMVVDDVILVESKAIMAFSPAHEVQLVNYLTATGIETGLLLNFGGISLDFKRNPRTYRPRKREPSEASVTLNPVNHVNPV